MTIGIYALYWENVGLVYIGQGNIETRYANHKRSASLKEHYNYKVQNAFDTYGIPELIILETHCTNIDLSEQSWIREFNATKEGLNILPGGEQLSGLNHPRSVYSKLSILKVFVLLARTTNTYEHISTRTKVNKNIVADISKGRTHGWLSEAYPEVFDTMQRNREIRKHRKVKLIDNKKYPPLKDAEGNIHHINNIAEFCRNHPTLSKNWETDKTGIGRIFRGVRPSYKGFRLA